MANTLKISWKELHVGTDKLSGSLPLDTSVIYAVPRGGLVVATLVAYKMGVKNVFTTTGLDESHANIFAGNYVIVDDICDTGKTLEKLRRRFPNAVTATLVKREGKGKVDHYGIYVSSPEWIEFPWALGDTTQPGKTPI